MTGHKKGQNPCRAMLVGFLLPRPRLGLFRAAGRAAATSNFTTGTVVEIPEGVSEQPPVTSEPGVGSPGAGTGRPHPLLHNSTSARAIKQG